MNANIVNRQNFHADYKIFGHEGKKGGDGGNGGRGGEGGNPGMVTLYELNAKSGIFKHFERGRSGRDGKGGERGLGGWGGNHINARCRMYRPDPFLRIFGAQSSTDWDLREQIENYSRGCPGKNGGDSTNTRGLQPLDPPNIISEPFENVTCYKRFLIENLNCRFKRSSLMSFFNAISENDEIKSIYNNIGLIEEFQCVEHERIRSTVEQSLFIHIYQSLLSRISDHVKRLKGLKDESTLEVLKYLYTTILSQIFVLTDKSKTDLIIDLSKYLDTIKVDIETLKELQMAGRKLSIIKELKEDYNCNVNKKIEEAQTFIIEQILPEFDSVKQQIDNDLHLLIEETIQLQLAAKEEKDYLIIKRGEIEDSLVQKNIFNSFKLIANVLSFLGPVGEAASRVIEKTTSVLGSLVSNESEKPPETDPSISSFVEIVKNGINVITKGSLSSLNNLLGVVSNEISNCPEILQDLLPVIEEIKKRKNNMDLKSLGMTEIRLLENDLKLALRRKEEMMKPQEHDPKSKDALKMISRLNKIVEFGSIIQDFQGDNKLETEKLNEITYAIDQADKKFLRLKQYEERIYDSIAPMIKNIEENTFETTSNMDSKSRVSLDITKWQVQSSLKKVQLQMQGLTEGFKAQHDIVRCFDMLQEAMTIIIKVYDRIEYYREQKTFANYIADISSVAVSNINVSNQRLVKALNKLDITLKSNLILNQYKTALNAFNQWVFPFSQNYIEDSMLPSHFKFETTIESLVTNCVFFVDHMKNKVEAYKISVMKNDKYIHHEEFNSRNRSTEPFFVWKNCQYRHLISRLLSGQEIILKAEVKKSPMKKDAIKFNFIEFFFRHKNESLQLQLDQIMKGFDIQATHTGNSYYRYLNKIYLITSDQQTLCYSLEKNADGENVRTNAVYDKIRRGDLMMSPYTLWQLKLVRSTSRSSFEELKMFEDDTDLELIGHGSYVMNLKQFNLENEDYRLVEIYNEFDQYLD